jgi:YVTN family beta-propeller protein
VTLLDRDGGIQRTVPVGQRPWGLALNEDGTRLYTANGVSNDVSVVDTQSGAVLATIPVGDGPWGIAVQKHSSVAGRSR